MRQELSEIIEEFNALVDVPLGLNLLRLCVHHRIPVNVVTNKLDVSRTTVYSWARCGGVSKHLRPKVEEYIAEIQANSAHDKR